jgi:hypothetical protein
MHSTRFPNVDQLSDSDEEDYSVYIHDIETDERPRRRLTEKETPCFRSLQETLEERLNDEDAWREMSLLNINFFSRDTINL